MAVLDELLCFEETRHSSEAILYRKRLKRPQKQTRDDRPTDVMNGWVLGRSQSRRHRARQGRAGQGRAANGGCLCATKAHFPGIHPSGSGGGEGLTVLSPEGKNRQVKTRVLFIPPSIRWRVFLFSSSCFSLSVASKSCETKELSRGSSNQ